MAKSTHPQIYVSWTKPDCSSIKLDRDDFQTLFHKAMGYVHNELNSSDLKKEIVKYLKTLDKDHPLLDDLKYVHENRISTFGKYMYILNHKGDIPPEVNEVLVQRLESVVLYEKAKNYEAVEEKQAEKASQNLTPVSIQDRLLERAKQIASEIEGWIDDFVLNKAHDVKTATDFDTLFKTNELKAPHMRFLKNIFQNRADEISLAASGKDKELTEAYSNFSKKELKAFDQFFKNMFSACDMLNEAAKVSRTPRKKKAVSQEKLVSKLTYKKEEASLRLVSLNPTQILGSKEVWLYNVKTRKLSQYKALDERGLSVKGTSIINYSSDSKEKLIRKPEETLLEFKKSSKIKLRTFLKDLSTVDTNVNGRVNEHHIILRVDK